MLSFSILEWSHWLWSPFFIQMWKVQHLVWAQFYGLILGGTAELFWGNSDWWTCTELSHGGTTTNTGSRGAAGPYSSHALQSFNTSDAFRERKRTGKQDQTKFPLGMRSWTTAIILATMWYIFQYKNILHEKGSSSKSSQTCHGSSIIYPGLQWWRRGSLSVTVFQPGFPPGIWHDDGLSIAI